MTKGTNSKPLTPHQFVRAFVSSLVMDGRTSIQPGTPEGRDAFYRVYQAIEDEISQLAEQGDSRHELRRQLIRIRNKIRPGPTGTFDGLVSILRDIQSSLTASPNVYYEEINFPISSAYAESYLSDLPEEQRKLLRRAAEAF